MNELSNPGPRSNVEPLVVSRDFRAPPERVFAAWSHAEAIKRWFSPANFTVPEATVDCRAGGVFSLCMRSPQGRDYFSRGVFLEVVPPARLSFKFDIEHGSEGAFTAITSVTLEAIEGGTRMTVRQDYEIIGEGARSSIGGASEGWRTTLDKLAAELERAEERSVVHSQFTLKRVFKAKPEAVFRAFADADAKAKWFVGGGGYAVLERMMDVRPGGKERLEGRWTNGTVSTFDATYFDVVPNARLVYAYEMHMNGRKISVSLATIALSPESSGTRMTLTEQGAFLDGYDDAGSREHGTNMLMDRLVASLDG